MKSLDEQIEYVRGQISWYAEIIDKNISSKSVWNGELEMCQAILDTLLQLKSAHG